jgi:hypothetical protein
MRRYMEKTPPLLIHSDLKAVNENLDVISNSMFEYQFLDYKRNKLNNLLVQNIVTGCTVMVNHKLIDLTRDNTPNDVIMHDWWLALVSSAFGQVIFIDKPTILYRQHGNNGVGAKYVNSLSYNIKRIKDNKIKKSIKNTYDQAKCFIDIFGQDLDLEKKEIIFTYLKLPTLNKSQKIISLYKYSFFKNSLLRKMGRIIYI